MAEAVAVAIAASHVGAGQMPWESWANLEAPHNAAAVSEAVVNWVDPQPELEAAALRASIEDSQVTGQRPPTATERAEALAVAPQEWVAYAVARAYATELHPAVAAAFAAASAYPVQ